MRVFLAIVVLFLWFYKPVFLTKPILGFYIYDEEASFFFIIFFALFMFWAFESVFGVNVGSR